MHSLFQMIQIFTKKNTVNQENHTILWVPAEREGNVSLNRLDFVAFINV